MYMYGTTTQTLVPEEANVSQSQTRTNTFTVETSLWPYLGLAKSVTTTTALTSHLSQPITLQHLSTIQSITRPSLTVSFRAPQTDTSSIESRRHGQRKNFCWLQRTELELALAWAWTCLMDRLTENRVLRLGLWWLWLAVYEARSEHFRILDYRFVCEGKEKVFHISKPKAKWNFFYLVKTPSLVNSV